MIKLGISVLSALAGCLVAGAALAGNITISDEGYTGTGWYSNREDQEVEPNCVATQPWDLEGFYLDGTTLTMVAGYSFLNGVPGSVSGAGDLFIDIDGDAEYGAGAHKPASYNPYQVVPDTFGYDSVLDMSFSTMGSTFSVFDIRSGGSALQLTTVQEQINDASNPWRYVSGGTQIVSNSAIALTSGLTDAQVQAMGYNVTGGVHNLASVSLAWLAPYLGSGTFVSHYTIECGNDNLMGSSTLSGGRGPVVPEPATFLLLGLGVVGVILRRKFRA